MNTDELNDDFKESVNLSETKPGDSQIARHGCLTAWLILTIAANSLLSLAYVLIYMLMPDKLPNVPFISFVVLVVICIANAYFSFMLLSWKKNGFYGSIITSIIILIVNINAGLSIGKSLIGLFGILILYVLLKMKKDGVAAWDYLK